MPQTHPLLHRNPRQRIDRPSDEVSSALSDAIDRSHLTYSQIAEAAGLCVKTISNLALGEVWPRRKTIDNLCRVLGLRLVLAPNDTRKRH